MTQHIEPIPAIFIREIKTAGVIKKEFLEYIKSSVEYKDWVQSNVSPRKLPKDYICQIAPVSRSVFLNDFINIRAMPDFPEDELLDNL